MYGRYSHFTLSNYQSSNQSNLDISLASNPMQENMGPIVILHLSYYQTSNQSNLDINLASNLMQECIGTIVNLHGGSINRVINLI